MNEYMPDSERDVNSGHNFYKSLQVTISACTIEHSRRHDHENCRKIIAMNITIENSYSRQFRPLIEAPATKQASIKHNNKYFCL